MDYIEYIIIAAILLIIAVAITRSKRKDFKVEANKLVTYLGGKENIANYRYRSMVLPIIFHEA